MQNDDALFIELLKEVKEISRSVSGVVTDVALIKQRQQGVIDKVDQNKQEVDAYCLEDRKMHIWIKNSVRILFFLVGLILLGGEELAKNVINQSIKVMF